MNHVLRKIFLVTYFHPREFIKLVVYYVLGCFRIVGVYLSLDLIFKLIFIRVLQRNPELNSIKDND